MKKKILILLSIVVVCMSVALGSLSLGSIGSAAAEDNEGANDIVLYGGQSTHYSGCWCAPNFRVNYEIHGQDGFLWSWDSVRFVIDTTDCVNLSMEIKFVDGKENKWQIKYQDLDGIQNGDITIQSDWNQVKRVEVTTTIASQYTPKDIHVYHDTVYIYYDGNTPW